MRRWADDDDNTAGEGVMHRNTSSRALLMPRPMLPRRSAALDRCSCALSTALGSVGFSIDRVLLPVSRCATPSRAVLSLMHSHCQRRTYRAQPVSCTASQPPALCSYNTHGPIVAEERVGARFSTVLLAGKGRSCSLTRHPPCSCLSLVRPPCLGPCGALRTQQLARGAFSRRSHPTRH